jgi:hypothetical protein
LSHFFEKRLMFAAEEKTVCRQKCFEMESEIGSEDDEDEDEDADEDATVTKEADGNESLKEMRMILNLINKSYTIPPGKMSSIPNVSSAEPDDMKTFDNLKSEYIHK